MILLSTPFRMEPLLYSNVSLPSLPSRMLTNLMGVQYFGDSVSHRVSVKHGGNQALKSDMCGDTQA